MNDHIDKELNLFPLVNSEDGPNTLTEQEAMEDATEIITALSNAEKVDMALPTVKDLEEHDIEMDSISKKALKSYQDLIDMGMNCTEGHAGRIFEVAATMLKTALDASDAKVNRKLKMIDLQLKKAKHDQEVDPEAVASQGIDRNEIIELFRNREKSQKSQETDK